MDDIILYPFKDEPIGGWRNSVTSITRKDVVRNILEKIQKDQLVDPRKQKKLTLIAILFEAKTYEKASSQVDYFSKVKEKLRTLETNSTLVDSFATNRSTNVHNSQDPGPCTAQQMEVPQSKRSRHSSEFSTHNVSGNYELLPSPLTSLPQLSEDHPGSLSQISGYQNVSTISPQQHRDTLLVQNTATGNANGVGDTTMRKGTPQSTSPNFPDEQHLGLNSVSDQCLSQTQIQQTSHYSQNVSSRSLKRKLSHHSFQEYVPVEQSFMQANLPPQSECVMRQLQNLLQHVTQPQVLGIQGNHLCSSQSTAQQYPQLEPEQSSLVYTRESVLNPQLTFSPRKDHDMSPQYSPSTQLLPQYPCTSAQHLPSSHQLPKQPNQRNGWTTSCVHQLTGQNGALPRERHLQHDEALGISNKKRIMQHGNLFAPDQLQSQILDSQVSLQSSEKKPMLWDSYPLSQNRSGPVQIECMYEPHCAPLQHQRGAMDVSTEDSSVFITPKPTKDDYQAKTYCKQGNLQEFSSLVSTTDVQCPQQDHAHVKSAQFGPGKSSIQDNLESLQVLRETYDSILCVLHRRLGIIGEMFADAQPPIPDEHKQVVAKAANQIANMVEIVRSPDSQIPFNAHKCLELIRSCSLLVVEELKHLKGGIEHHHSQERNAWTAESRGTGFEAYQQMQTTDYQIPQLCSNPVPQSSNYSNGQKEDLVEPPWPDWQMNNASDGEAVVERSDHAVAAAEQNAVSSPPHRQSLQGAADPPLVAQSTPATLSEEKALESWIMSLLADEGSGGNGEPGAVEGAEVEKEDQPLVHNNNAMPGPSKSPPGDLP